MATKRRDHRIGEDDKRLERELELRLGVEAEAPWRRDRVQPRQGHPDLRYLPQGRASWNTTLAALAFSQARSRGRTDILQWAAMHGARPSARAAELGDDALVLWHGTSRERAERIRDVGLFHKRGLWTTLDPWEALTHDEVLERADQVFRARRVGGAITYGPRRTGGERAGSP